MKRILSTELTRQLICDPAAGLLDPELAGVLEANPTLKGVHPLARARALLHLAPERLTPSLVRTALKTCWVAHDPRNGSKRRKGVHREEIVTHAIGPCRFYSIGRLQYYTAQPYELRARRLGMVQLAKIRDADAATAAVLIRLWNHDRRFTPDCRIRSSGEYLGSMEHYLESIGSIPVSDVWIGIESTGEIDHSGLDEEGCRLRGRELSEFCWLHFLTEQEARQLGVPTQDVPRDEHSVPTSAPAQAVQPEREDEDDWADSKSKVRYPDWVDPQWADKHGWINLDDLEWSYAKGEERPDVLMLLVGPNVSWWPEDPSALDDAPDSGDGRRQALAKWRISTSDPVLPPDAHALLADLRKMSVACGAGR